MSGEQYAISNLIYNTNILINEMESKQVTYDNTFANTTPMDINIGTIDPETGEIRTVNFPNVAKVKAQFESWKESVRDSIQEIRMENGVLVVDRVEPQADE